MSRTDQKIRPCPVESVEKFATHCTTGHGAFLEDEMKNEKTTYTPGPLMVVGGSVCRHTASGGDAEGWTVAEDRDGGEIVSSGYRTESDACLGAAAPDLLDAAKAARRALGELTGGPQAEPAILRMLCAAIARAEGE